MSLADLRRDYIGQPLSESESDANPFAQFARWFEQVRETEIDPTAMALATATRDGRPSVRNVLLKGVDDRGFVFYTNYQSRKAREIEATGRASLLFTWRSLERQVRIDGTVEKVSAAESDAYFATRPIESRWSVYASRQSEVVDSRDTLELMFNAAREKFDDHVPRPEWWGGIVLSPTSSSSGRDARAACTIGCAICTTLVARGAANASRPEGLPSLAQRALEIDQRHASIDGPPDLGESALRVEGAGARSAVERVQPNRIDGPVASDSLGALDQLATDARSLQPWVDVDIVQVDRFADRRAFRSIAHGFFVAILNSPTIRPCRFAIKTRENLRPRAMLLSLMVVDQRSGRNAVPDRRQLRAEGPGAPEYPPRSRIETTAP